MPTGCCGHSDCSCKIDVAGTSRLTIDGSGQPGDPFIVALSDPVFAAGHNITFDTTPSGGGTAANPWKFTTAYAPTAKLDHLPDVNVPAPSNGQVLSWNTATGQWVAAAPTVAPTGAVSHDTSLAGDGSPATPLGVAPITARLLGTFPTGIGLTDLGMSSVVQHFADATARTVGIPSPTVNMLSILASNPGVIEYWTGTKWSVLPNQTTWTATDEFMEMSGPYVAGAPVTVLVTQVSTTTDGSGVFDVIPAAQLTGRSGVLAVNVQETGAIGWKAMAYQNTNRVSGIAFRLTDGTPMAGQPVTATVQAILY